MLLVVYNMFNTLYYPIYEITLYDGCYWYSRFANMFATVVYYSVLRVLRVKIHIYIFLFEYLFFTEKSFWAAMDSPPPPLSHISSIEKDIWWEKNGLSSPKCCFGRAKTSVPIYQIRYLGHIFDKPQEIFFIFW